MGKKKRCSVSSVKHAPSPPSSTTVDPASKPPTLAVESLTPVILSECLQALEIFQHGNSVKAFRKIRQSISNHKDSPHLHFVEALLHSLLAKKAGKDSGKKIKHLNDAVRSAEFAFVRLRNSVHFALLLTDLYYQLAMMKCTPWEKVIAFCQYPLKIENLTDPGVDMFLEEDDMVNSSKESRIEDEKKQIMNYSQASNLIKALMMEILGNDKKDVEEEDSAITIHVNGMETRRKKIEAIIGDWIVRKQKKSHFSTKKLKGNVEKREKYKRFWNSRLTSEEKKGFRMVSVEELERHFNSLKRNLGVDFSEAISFGKKYNTWKYWECFCNGKIGDCKMFRDHVMESHGSNFDRWRKCIGFHVDWIEMILKADWKPMDSGMARNFIPSHLESLSAYTCDTDVSSGMCMDDEEWPYCVDTKREEILQRICCMYLLLYRNQCLAMSHFLWPILYTVEKFEILISLSQVCRPKSLKLICFLEASQLEEILYFLKNKADTFGLTGNPGMNSFLDNYISGDPLSDIQERAGFSRDLSRLLVDEHILRREIDSTNHVNGVADSGSVVPLSSIVGEDDVLPDNYDIVSWLYQGPIEEDLESWTSLRDSQRKKVMEISEILDAQGEHLLEILKGSSVERRRIEIVRLVERIYHEEIEKRDKCPGHVAQDYANLLRKRCGDLKGSDNIENIMESEVISHALEEAVAAEECGAKDKMRLQDPFTPMDCRIRSALQRLSKQLIENIALVDAVVLWSMAAIERYESIIEKMSVYDYKPMIVPLLKSFLQTRLEELFNEDARKMSDAVIDAILAGLALDAEKINRGCDAVKQKQDGNKNKKMKKNSRKAKESKAINGGKNLRFHHEEQDENSNSEIVISATELEPLTANEERLFKEHLEYQKQFEIEASLKVNVFGTGRRNEVADCFVNVILQSLWHLREFREEFTSRSLSSHKHIGNPCVVCTLYEIFSALSISSADNPGEAVAPTSLVIALRTGYHGKIIQEGQMNDASEFLKFILESLHESFNVDFSDFESECKYSGSLDCFSAGCFVHRIFGMDHFERIDCFYCHVDSRHRKYTTLSLNLNAYNLGMMKNKHGKGSFEVLLKLVEMTGQLTCESCGLLNHSYHTLWCLPHVFTVGWKSANESSKDISTILCALSAELDLSVLFQGYQPDNVYFLTSVVCFSEDRQRYICFIYNHRHEKYVLYDDTTVEVTGSWKDVLAIFVAMHLQPRILFYLHKSSIYFGD